jgi:hypothetical protein
MTASPREDRASVLSVLAALALLSLTFAPSTAAAQETEGRISGRVVDANTGRPLQLVEIAVEGMGSWGTDLDGRFRTTPLPAGVYRISAQVLAYAPAAVDSVVVRSGDVTHVDFALQPAALELEGVTVEVEAASRPETDASLLAIQQRAPSVSDGISAEAIARTPDSDAADAVTRVPGVAVFDNRYVIVRGLPERYSNTTLNGTPLASPEPLKRVVPLDIFPAALLDAVVTTKAATPDIPGDFSGGSVEIKTREFPDEFVFQLRASAGYNSQTTFKTVPWSPKGGLDFLGIDDGRRALPDDPPTTADRETEAFAENLYNVWNPPDRTARPDFGFGFNLGGRVGDENPFGYVVSFTYGNRTAARPDRVFSLYRQDLSLGTTQSFVFNQSQSEVDWGATANFSWRLGASNKFGFKNILTQNATEDVFRNVGFRSQSISNERHWQMRYIERTLFQSQLSGEHALGFLLDSRFEWKASLSKARRYEPDNRQVILLEDPSRSVFEFQGGQEPAKLFWRDLDDTALTGQLDWTLPFSLWGPQDALFKVGALRYHKERDSRARFFRYTDDPTAANVEEILSLPIEELFTPENIGSAVANGSSAVLFSRGGGTVESYVSDEDIQALYGMLDFPLLRSLRLVGGLRYEQWDLVLDRLQLDQDAPVDTANGNRITRANGDPLWSANLTAKLSNTINLRLAAFRSVARPDAREISPDLQLPISGECTISGNPELERAAILNLDARWEIYPRPGEIIAVSGFWKDFESPIVETVSTPAGGQCTVVFNNAEEARNVGAELEFRKSLDFISSSLERWSTGVNMTYVDSRVKLDTTLAFFEEGPELQGQSPFILNGSLRYFNPESRFDFSILLNYFADRIARYGQLGSGRTQFPNWIEAGRFQLDFKLTFGLGSHWMLSFSGQNVLDSSVEFFNENETGRAITALERPGVRLKMAAGYEF